MAFAFCMAIPLGVLNKKAHRFEDIFVGESVNTPGFIIVEDTRESYSKNYTLSISWRE